MWVQNNASSSPLLLRDPNPLCALFHLISVSSRLLDVPSLSLIIGVSANTYISIEMTAVGIRYFGLYRQAHFTQHPEVSIPSSPTDVFFMFIFNTHFIITPWNLPWPKWHHLSNLWICCIYLANIIFLAHIFQYIYIIKIFFKDFIEILGSQGPIKYLVITTQV